jgi:hypothetical protein
VGKLYPTKRKREWDAQTFFEKVDPTDWPLSSFYISSGVFQIQKIIKMEKEWKKLLKVNNKKTKLSAKFDT